MLLLGLLSLSQLVPSCCPPLVSLLFTLELFPADPDPLRFEEGLLLFGDRRIDDLNDPCEMRFKIYGCSYFVGGNDKHFYP